MRSQFTQHLLNIMVPVNSGKMVLALTAVRPSGHSYIVSSLLASDVAGYDVTCQVGKAYNNKELSLNYPIY